MQKVIALFGSATLAALVTFAHAAPGVIIRPNPNPTCPPPVVTMHDGLATSSVQHCPQ